MAMTLPPISSPRFDRVRPMVVVRVMIAAVAICLAIAPAFSAERAVLRGDVTATDDVLTLADLVENAAGPAAGTPLFRAPALGDSGTIQARRIVEAAGALGIDVDAVGKTQIVVTRAARRIGLAEIEAAVKKALEMRHGIDARALSLSLDGPPPALVVAPEMTAAAVADEVSFDRRSRRVSATVRVGSGPDDRRAAARVTGTVAELVEVAVVGRAIARGETVQAGDLAVERRPKESVPVDVQADAPALAGQVARRALGAGAIVRTGDFAKPEIVTRGEAVIIVYEIPGLTLTLRGRASESGAQGDAIAVVNPQSKKTLQATVVAPGKVAVGAALPGRVAAPVAQR